jgi:hypothetical protein
MPWDGAELFENRTLVKLGQVERLLASEQHWCKGSLCDAGGRHCLVGAIAAVGGRRELMRPVIRAVRDVSGAHYWRIEAFNDAPGTTHPDVMRVLRRARENVLADLARPPQPLAQKLGEVFRGFLPRRRSASVQTVEPRGAMAHPVAFAEEIVESSARYLDSSAANSPTFV